MRVFEVRGRSLIARSVRPVGEGAEAGFELAPRGTDVLEGRVLSRGVPAAAVPVVAGVGSELRAECLTDEDGRFDLRGAFGSDPVVLEVGAARAIMRVELPGSARQNLELTYEPGSATPLAPMFAALRHRPSDGPGWTRHGPRFAPAEQRIELSVGVADEANVRVDGASLFFHAAGAPHAVFLGTSAPGLTVRLPLRGRLLATGAGGLLGHHVLQGSAGGGSRLEVALTLRAPVRIEGSVHAPALAGRVPPVVARSPLEEGWVVEMARNPHLAGRFSLPQVPAAGPGRAVEVSCGEATGSFLQTPGSMLKVHVSEAQDGLRIARQQ